MRVPLYSISAGDLGIEAGKAQSRLVQIFDSAKNWNTFLLIEADIFLGGKKRQIMIKLEMGLCQVGYLSAIFHLTRLLSFKAKFEAVIKIQLISYPSLSSKIRVL
jgi:hypothetical protein